MNGKVNTPSEKITLSKSAIMVSDLSPEPQLYTRISRTPRITPKAAATFGKRSNSMRRNPKAEVTKQGWLYKQASSGVKQWNKRWFVLTDKCLFYYKDDKEDTVLGSLPLLSFRIEGVEPSDNITRKFAFKVKLEKEEGEDGELRGPVVFCMQAQHAGTRTYYFSADSHEEQEEWIRAMSEATEVNVQLTQRMNTDLNHTMVTKTANRQTQQPPHTHTHNDTDSEVIPYPKINGVSSLETPTPTTPCSDQVVKDNDGRLGESGGEGEDEGGGPAPDHMSHLSHHPNGWGNYGPRNTMPHDSNSKAPPSRSHSRHCAPQRHPEGGVGPSNDPREQQDNVVLRRGFVPRTAPERVAQRKTSMAQLQQWVNQRRGMASQEDINSPSCYYPVNRGVSGDYYGFPSGPPYVDELTLYPPGVRPDSICSVSAVGGYDRRWTFEEKRHSLRDRPHQLYGPPMHRDQWGPTYYDGMETSMRRLSIQPRSRSVPRSPSSSSGGPYSPVPPNFASPARSPSTPFDRFPGRMRDDVIYADPSVYSMRRSLSSPKYDYPGDRRSSNQGLYHYNYPVSPSIHNKMEDILDLQLQRNLDYLDQQVPPFHDVYSRELHPTLKLNEIETSKLLGRLCEQNRIWKDHEAVVHRLRMEKDSLEEALVATHQEMDRYHNQPLALDKLRFRKETLQNQLINIRGELSQASSALTTSRMEFEALEDEANAIHGDLWEQLNAGGQSELVHRHIQKEFWRVQDVLEGLHKNNSSRGTDTAKHRVASGASGSFSTNSPASPLSSVSFTSPLSPFSPVPGSQVSPTKQLGPQVSTGHTQPRTNPYKNPGTGPCFDSSTNPEVCIKSSPKPRPKSCIVPNFKTDPKPSSRPKSCREPDTSLHTEHINNYGPENNEHTFPQLSRAFQHLEESLSILDTVIEESDQNVCRTKTNFDLPRNPTKHSNQYSCIDQTHFDHQEVSWLTSNVSSEEVKIGLRKDVYPDSHPYHISAGAPYHGGLRNLTPNKRCSMPDYQILFLQDSYLTDVLSFRHSADLFTSSVPCFRGANHEPHLHHQIVSRSSCHAGAGARPLSYPNNQLVKGGLSIAPAICAVTQSDSARSRQFGQQIWSADGFGVTFYVRHSDHTDPAHIVSAIDVSQSRFAEQNNMNDVQDMVQDRQSTMNKVGIVPPRTKSPTDESQSRSLVSRHNGRRPNGISRERPKSAVFPAELKLKMSVEEQNERIRRNQSSSVRDKRRSLNLSAGQSPANYKVIRRRLTAHEIDIKDLEVAIRGQGQESPREEIARLRRLKVEPEPYNLDISKELLTPDKVLIPERYLDMEDNTPLSPEEQKEKQRKLERIKTLIAKSNLQNMVPLLDGPVEGGAPVTSQQQLQEQEKRIEISCALANEASRRSRLLSARCAPSPLSSPTSLTPPPSSADFPNSAHIMKA